MYDPVSKKILISRDVLFCEDEFPFQYTSETSDLDIVTTTSPAGYLKRKILHKLLVMFCLTLVSLMKMRLSWLSQG